MLLLEVIWCLWKALGEMTRRDKTPVYSPKLEARQLFTHQDPRKHLNLTSKRHPRRKDCCGIPFPKAAPCCSYSATSRAQSPTDVAQVSAVWDAAWPRRHSPAGVRPRPAARLLPSHCPSSAARLKKVRWKSLWVKGITYGQFSPDSGKINVTYCQ